MMEQVLGRSVAVVMIRLVPPSEEPALIGLLPGYPPPDRRTATLAATAADGRLLGWGALSDHLHGNPLEPGRLSIQVAVAPKERGLGYGRHLTERLLQLAREAGASHLLASANAHDPAALALGARTGFLHAYDMLEASLPLDGYDLDRWQGALQRCRDDGIAFATLASEPDPLETGRALWALDYRVSVEIPEWNGIVMPFEQYRSEMLAGPETDPEAVFIARADQEIAGFCASGRRPDGSGYTWTLGVERRYRGRGIGLALKILTIGWALRAGLTHLQTHNNPANQAVVSLNRSLGYETTAVIRNLILPL